MKKVVTKSMSIHAITLLFWNLGGHSIDKERRMTRAETKKSALLRSIYESISMN